MPHWIRSLKDDWANKCWLSDEKIDWPLLLFAGGSTGLFLISLISWVFK